MKGLGWLLLIVAIVGICAGVGWLIIKVCELISKSVGGY